MQPVHVENETSNSRPDIHRSPSPLSGVASMKEEFGASHGSASSHSGSSGKSSSCNDLAAVIKGESCDDPWIHGDPWSRPDARPSKLALTSSTCNLPKGSDIRQERIME